MSVKSLFPLTLEVAQALMQSDPMANWIHFRLEELDKECVRASMNVEQKHVAPNGFLHGSVATAFADITCGLGTALYLPSPQHILATLEIKTNFMGTARSGELLCEAIPRHTGSVTQVWDATVTHKETGKTTVLFRCTQIILENNEGRAK